MYSSLGLRLRRVKLATSDSMSAALGAALSSGTA